MTLSFIRFIFLFIVLFINIPLLIMSIRRLKKLENEFVKMESYESEHSKHMIDKIEKTQEKIFNCTKRAEREVIKEILDMRAEWDMQALKQNILSDSRGNSKNWSKWHDAFGGKGETKAGGRVNGN